MDQKKNPPKQVKFEVRHAPMSLKIVLSLLILFSMAALTALRWIHLDLRAETQDLKSEAAVIEYENGALKEKLASLGSVQSIKDIAKEELGLVDPDTILIDPN